MLSSDPADAVSYPFIEDFCGDEDELNVYQSLIIHENGNTQRGLYSIEAFSFNHNEDGDIYLHCEVSVFSLRLSWIIMTIQPTNPTYPANPFSQSIQLTMAYLAI